MVELSTLFNITDLIYMKTSVLSRLNILCVMFKIITLFTVILFARLYVRIAILLTCVNNLHDRIISIRGEIRPKQNSGCLNELCSWNT
jgi:hypothetical protein